MSKTAEQFRDDVIVLLNRKAQAESVPLNRSRTQKDVQLFIHSARLLRELIEDLRNVKFETPTDTIEMLDLHRVVSQPRTTGE